MPAPKNLRLNADFDEWCPQGLFLVGEIQAMTEYQSQEDRARNRPVRARVDEVTGLPLYRGTFADPAADKDREKSITVVGSVPQSPESITASTACSSCSAMTQPSVRGSSSPGSSNVLDTSGSPSSASSA